MEVVRQCIPALLALLQKGDNEIDADACWALSYLTDGKRSRHLQSGASYSLLLWTTLIA